MVAQSSKRNALGKGLSALIPGSDRADSNISRSYVSLDLIDANPNQPRREFDEEALHTLAHSIETHGLLQPIVLRAVGSRYQIVAGERRFRASKIAELKQIPATIKSLDDNEVFEVALVENLQREDLNPMETARGFSELIDALGVTQQEASRRLGISRSALTNKLRLLALPASVQLDIEKGVLSEGHGRALLSLIQPGAIEELAQQTIAQGLSVREVEQRAKSYKSQQASGTTGTPGQKKDAGFSKEYERLQTKFEDLLGTKVRIQPKSNSKSIQGKIVISYYSMDDLDKLTTILTS